MTKFRVGVVTILEVEIDSDDERNARRVAEGAVEHLIELNGPIERGKQPVIRWRHRNGSDYQVAVVRRPIEVGAAARNGYFTVGIPQPVLEDHDVG